MEIYAKGQLSYLILNCLLERDYYGLDIIAEIKDRSDGRIVLKKPSVYSNLTRMEKQGHVTSYVQSSDVGPNRKYYSITDKGRNTYAELKDYFDRNKIDVFKDFVGDGVVEEPAQTTILQSQPATQAEEIQVLAQNIEEKQESIESNDFFDFSSLNQNQNNENMTEDDNQPAQVQQQEPPKDDGRFLTDEDLIASPTENQEQPETRQFSVASLLRQNQENAEIHQQQNEEISEPVQENVAENQQIQAESLQNVQNVKENAQDNLQTIAQSDEQQDKVLSNQEIYDISKDMAKYRRKRSFAEDQMAFAVSESLDKDDEKTKANIEELKSSLLATKEKYNQRMTEEEFHSSRFSQQTAPTQVQNTTFSQPAQPQNFQPAYNFANNQHAQNQADDGVFITDQVSRDSVQTAKKIEPPRLKVSTPANQPLPAPKKDSSIDLSHKEIISRLYAKGKGSENADDPNFIYDYEDLQDYYKSQGISFRQYEKSSYKVKHNTNKLNLGASVLCFVLSVLATALLFTCFYLTGKAYSATNFLYIVLPLLAAVDVGYRGYVCKTRTSWEPKPLLSSWFVWMFAILGLGAVIGLNFAFGMRGENFAIFCNTLFLPAIYIGIYLPLYHYVKKALYVKLWK